MGLGEPVEFSLGVPYNQTHITLSSFSDPNSIPVNTFDPTPNTGVALNATTLKHFNYSVYSNATLSNTSDCYLLFPRYWQPALNITLFPNGTFANATSCDIPLYPIAGRGTTGLVLAVLFGLTIVFSLINLRKHGTSHLPHSKRFRLVGRRWVWYWAIATAAFAMVSGITGVDVDRTYLQGLAIILQAFFYYMTGLAISAAVWESVRHWGSWRERQVVEVDMYAVKQESGTWRVREEFWLPLVFYLFWWLNFFMIIPRSWGAASLQRSASQQQQNAAPMATEVRFKIGAVFGFIDWVITAYHLRHTLHFYPTPAADQAGGEPGRASRVTRHFQLKHALILFLLLIKLAQDLLASIDFSYSLIRFGGRFVPFADSRYIWPFCFGFVPILLIVMILNIYGLIDENEDKVIIRERRIRGVEQDRSLGIERRPGWWAKGHGAAGTLDQGQSGSTMTTDYRLKALASEGPAGERRDRQDLAGPAAWEMKDLKGGHRETGASTRVQHDPGLRTTNLSGLPTSPAPEEATLDKGGVARVRHKSMLDV